MGFFIFLIFVGSMLFIIGFYFMMSAIPFPPRYDSWGEIKDDFRIWVGKPKFRVGAVCFVIGTLIIFSLMNMFI